MADEIVIDSIKKMLELQMSDDEIIGSLVDAGVDYDYAAKMLNSVKNNKPVPKTQKTKMQEREEVSEQEENYEKTKEVLKDVDNTSLGVWQEGVVTIITQKLDELDNKQKSLDEDIKNKVNAITSLELSKMKAVIDSQRTLLVSKLDLSVASKLNEIKKQMESTLNVLQDVNSNTQKKLDDIDTLTRTLTDMKKTLSQQIDTVQNVKDSLGSTIEDIKRKSNTELQDIFVQYKSQLGDITNRTNSTLNLASKILESLVNASKAKIDNYCNTKLDSFMKDLQTKINVGDIKLALDKLNTIKDLEARISSMVDTRVSSMLSEKDFEDSITDLNRRIMDLEKQSKGKQNADFEDISSRLDELEMYKEQNSNLIAKLLKDSRNTSLKEVPRTDIPKKNQKK
ncbi:MAG: hypothetical protein COT14_00095 [Candidatus Diapherotrites archaeon CG08_land_8_20_14_0_20_30_16]|nr:MAG: hypothetical protein COT14_00095 [Candidatus Diapherotrites archaeon CG08_land_8_20_14_0_20_30_16]